MLSRSIISNYTGSILGLAISKGVRFLAVAFCIRMVGDFSWGQVATTLAAMSFAGLLIDQGLASAVLLFRLQDRAADGRLLLFISGYRVVMALLLIAALQGFHYWLHPVDPLFRMYSLVLIPRALGLDWWFQRRERFQLTLYIASVRAMSFFLLALLLVRPDAGAGAVILVEMVSETASVACAAILVAWSRNRSRVAATPQPASFSLGSLLAYSIPFLLLGLLNTLHASADVLLIRFFFGNSMVAEYDVGLKVALMYFFSGATIVQILRPKITRMHLHGEDERLALVLKSASSSLLLLSSLFIIPSFFFSGEILHFLFGLERPLAEYTFRWAALWVGTSFLTMLCADTLLSMGKRRDYMRGAAMCAATGIILNLIFLPVFSGQAAIVSKICAEAVFLGVVYLKSPVLVRRQSRRSILSQAFAMAAFVLAYFLSLALDSRAIGVCISLVCLAVVIYQGRLFTRSNLKVLREN